MRSLSLGILFVSLISCGPVKPANGGGEGADTARKAIGLSNAKDLWRCAGKIKDREKEYYAATLQETADGRKYLLASHVTVDGKDVSQKYLLMTDVVVGKTHLTYRDEYLEVNSNMKAAKRFGTYDYSSEVVEFYSGVVNVASVKLDCPIAEAK